MQLDIHISLADKSSSHTNTRAFLLGLEAQALSQPPGYSRLTPMERRFGRHHPHKHQQHPLALVLGQYGGLIFCDSLVFQGVLCYNCDRYVDILTYQVCEGTLLSMGICS